MKKKLIVIFTLLILIVGTSFALYKTNLENNKLEETNDEEVIEEYVPEVYKASLIMGGDALIHYTVYNDNYNDGEYDFTYSLSEIKKLVSNYDLAYYNQETILGGSEYGLSSYPEFNSPKEVGDGFVDAGFNLVSLANNHTLDGYYSKGASLINSSIEYWDSKNGVITAGSYTSNEDKEDVIIGEVNNITYALLSYTYGTNGIYVGDDESYLVNYTDKEQIKSDVEKYRDKVDVLMVAMHWGEEYVYNPTDYQVDLAHYLADLDVDIVIGNHAHVIEPIEWIDDTLVTYALGNIISGQNFSVQTLTGALCSLDITKTINEDGTSTITLDNVKAHLFYCLENDRWKMVPYSSLTDEQLKDHDLYFDFFKSVLQGTVNGEAIDNVSNAYNPYENSILLDYPVFSNINSYSDLIVE